MYIPPQYKNENISEVRDFIKAHSFAILVNQSEGKPWATHTPLELGKDEEGKDILIGHIAKANAQWKAFENNSRVLCIFHGPHSYISSSWYKEEEVPTWNYIAVHIYGRVTVMSTEEVLRWLHGLVDHYEKEEKNPVSLEQMSPATLKQVRGVVGFRIQIDEIQAAFKLSQGREEDHERIIRELRSKDEPGRRHIADIMKKKEGGRSEESE
ncbi:MAG: FMN-binding negative transcriptional regulator [Flavobacteriaceae bacterium]|nr:FMN-binding negative transcriptional regulator [Muriicola sp.]NNC62744.1 FMN-binding negative transcriptional regulator [Eudoraea sp.]NNK20838.1 FMN-binding negative transcriptional regulator [Flavobacteriaceae bacterium]MBT8291330.1 FMN-binding negative transcriptional regulator [Muriicola sp.]NNK36530.1 FMN-binding negative transcriptional regulator [Eudoraea sp.]